jgi:hypothetical protein
MKRRRLVARVRRAAVLVTIRLMEDTAAKIARMSL